MSWKFEKNIVTGNPEIVISGFENGIADSPYLGIADIRNVDITTAPQQGSVAFATAACTLPPIGYTGVAFSSVATTDIFTTATTTGFYTGMALTCVTISGAGSAVAGVVYYVGNITATTFKLYLDIALGTVLDVTVDRTGTFTIQTFGTPSDSLSVGNAAFASESGLAFKYTFIMTSDGLVWYLTYLIQPFQPGGSIPQNTLQFLGNTGHSTAGTTNQTGIVVLKGYLFVFQSSKIDYISLGNISNPNPSTTWVYGWKNTTASAQGHRGIISPSDGGLYFCNAANIGVLIEQEGTTFDPTSSTTYIYSPSALGLPATELATCIAQFGINVIIGGIRNFLYFWDKKSLSYTAPIILAENYTKCIVAVNNSAYVFAGNRGYIYITNGSNIQIFKKFPDSLSGTIAPYYNWGWSIYQKNQLFFSISATANTFTTTISTFAGIWSIDLSNSQNTILRMSNSLSYGTYAGTVPVLVPMGHTIPTGDGIYAGWINSTGGIDYTSGSPYVNFESRIDSDIISVGTFLSPSTFSNIEFKLGKPLVSGEQIRLSQRSNLMSSFVPIGTTTTAGLLSDSYTMNFENVQWLQIRAEYSSTVTNPSYVLLKEIRFRK